MRTTASPMRAGFDALVAHERWALDDPHAVYRSLRSAGPVIRDGDHVLVLGYREVRQAVTRLPLVQGLTSRRGPRFRAAVASVPLAEREAVEDFFRFWELRIGATDGDAHRRLRELVMQAFTPTVIAGIADHVERVVAGLLDEIEGSSGTVDLIPALTYRLPLIVICEMLDIPASDQPLVRAWAQDIARYSGSDWEAGEHLAAARSSMLAFRRYLERLLVHRRHSTTSELLDGLLAAESRGDRLRSDELIALMIQLLVAGHETTTNLLSSGLVELLGRWRAEWQALCARPDLAASAVEELLRFVSPAQMIFKLADDDVTIADVAVRAGETVTLVLAAANRDPEIFAAPDRLDVGRPAAPHLAFSGGAHYCLGAALTRLEATKALEALVTRFPDMELVAPVTWQSNHVLRGPVSVPVKMR